MALLTDLPDTGDDFGHRRSSPDAYVAVIVMSEDGRVLIGMAEDGIDKGKITVPLGRIRPFESFSDAAKRTALEWSGTEVEPQTVLFVSESIDDGKDDHRVVLFVFSNLVKMDVVPPSFKCQWVDVRDLGKLQESLSDLAADGFFKLSLVLRHKAQAQAQTQAQAPKQEG